MFFGVVILPAVHDWRRVWSEPEVAPATRMTGGIVPGERLPWAMPVGAAGVLLLPVLALNGLLAHESQVVPQLGEPGRALAVGRIPDGMDARDRQARLRSCSAVMQSQPSLAVHRLACLSVTSGTKAPIASW